MDDVCTQIKIRLAQMVSEDNFKTWIDPVKFLNYKDGLCSVVVPNAFFRDWIIENFEPLFKTLLKEATHEEARIEYLLKKGRSADREEEHRPQEAGAFRSF